MHLTQDNTRVFKKGSTNLAFENWAETLFLHPPLLLLLP